MAKTETRHPESRLKARILRLSVLVVTKVATQRYLKKLLASQPSGAIFCVSLCIKFGESVTLAEANTLRFIARHTTIPVPKVYYAFTLHGKSYILMERIRGETIAKRWPSLADSSKASIFRQLRGMIDELRAIPPNGPGVSNLDGGSIHDFRLPQTSTWGPFETVHDFHLQLRNHVTLKSLGVRTQSSPSAAAMSDIRKVVEFHDSVTQPTVLTHGDLSSFNILLRDDRVVGIIDWDTAGWLPYYWEYATAWHANPQNLFWQNEVGKFLEVYEAELEMEKLRRMYFGEF